jgi:hypothetical protein
MMRLWLPHLGEEDPVVLYSHWEILGLGCNSLFLVLIFIFTGFAPGSSPSSATTTTTTTTARGMSAWIISTVSVVIAACRG